MKINYVLMLSLLTACFFACDKSETVLPSESEKGANISFEIALPQGQGDGSAESPIKITPPNSTDLIIRQLSEYVDADGTAYKAEQTAAISMSILHESVHVKDIAELTQFTVTDKETVNETGTSLVTHNIAQTFAIGEQEISVNLSYDTSTIITSANEKILMPYIQVNKAKFGNFNLSVEKSRGKAAVSVSAVKIRPLGRAEADGTAVEVDVYLSTELQTVNSDKSDSQILNFIVTYTGIVETLRDQTAMLSYTWETSGTSSADSPFVQTEPGTMEVLMKQSSTYIDEHGNVEFCEPTAKIVLTTPVDTIWTDTEASLKQLTSTNAQTTLSPIDTKVCQAFSVCGRDVTVDYSYTAGATAADGAVIMPYYTLSDAKLLNVETRELSCSTPDISAYEATATFTQTATAAGASGDFPQKFDIEYQIKYIGAIKAPPHIVNINYKRGYGWYPPYYNLPLRHYHTITREKIFSDGSTVTEHYKSANYMMTLLCHCGNPYGRSGYFEIPLPGHGYLSFQRGPTNDTDTSSMSTSVTGVPNLEKLGSPFVSEEGFQSPLGPDVYNLYEKEYSDEQFGTGKHTEGWYIRWCVHRRTVSLPYEDYHEVDDGIRRYMHDPGFVDIFYYFEDTDTIIDFHDMWPEYKRSGMISDTFTYRGPSRIYKYETEFTYLGQKFYIATVDTVFVTKKAPQTIPKR